MTKQNGHDNQGNVPQPIARANAPLVPGQGLVPQNLEDLYRVATAFCASGLMPKGMNRPEQVMVAAQMGMEMGLTLMQSVQNIAVVNGRPSLWGDMPLALVKRSNLLEYINEEIVNEGDNLTARCTVKRKNDQEIVRTFSWQDAVRAKLTGKDVWKNYPKRMLQMRARSWALKDLFPDVIRGVAIAEYNDYASGHEAAGEPVDVTPVMAEPSIEDLMGSPAGTAAEPTPKLPAEQADDGHVVIDQEGLDAFAGERGEEPAPPLPEQSTGPGEHEVAYYKGLGDRGYTPEDLPVFEAFNEAVLQLDPNIDREKHYKRAHENFDQHLAGVQHWSASDQNPTGRTVAPILEEGIEILEEDDEPDAGAEAGGDEVDVLAANQIGRWISMRSSKDPKAGFAGYVLAHREAFRAADPDVKKKAAKKWKNLYKSKPPWESKNEYAGGKELRGTAEEPPPHPGPAGQALVSEVADMPEEQLAAEDPEADVIAQESAAVAEALREYQAGAKKHIGIQAARDLKMGISPMTLDGRALMLAKCQEIEAKLGGDAQY